GVLHFRNCRIGSPVKNQSAKAPNSKSPGVILRDAWILHALTILKTTRNCHVGKNSDSVALRSKRRGRTDNPKRFARGYGVFEPVASALNGTVKMTLVPFPALLCRSYVPPIAASRCAIFSRPLPPGILRCAPVDARASSAGSKPRPLSSISRTRDPL